SDAIAKRFFAIVKVSEPIANAQRSLRARQPSLLARLAVLCLATERRICFQRVRRRKRPSRRSSTRCAIRTECVFSGARRIAYTAATLVPLARVGGRRHSPSDAFVGSVIGYFFGDYVYRRRHAPSEKSTLISWLATHVDIG